MKVISQFTDFIQWIENLPAQTLSEADKLRCLKKTRLLLSQHQLLPKIPVITVTGTNGKGSTVHALASLLIASGYRVGCMTSPHLFSYTERFSIDLQPVSEQAILNAVNRLAHLIELNQFNFAYILFLIGLYLFQQANLDILILEVGLGGRLDPSNALDADLIILTQVALDHTHLLGNTRESIGKEKAGLLRKNQIFICGDANPPATVIQQANQLNCQSFWLNQQFGFFMHQTYWNLWLPDRMLCSLRKPLMHSSNIACAVLAASKIKNIALNQEQLSLLTSLQLPGRRQTFYYRGCEIILDVAHNPAAVQYLADYLKTLPPNPNTFALFGAMADKDIPQMLEIMSPIIHTWWLTDVPGKRAAPAHDIAQHLSTSSPIKSFNSAKQACEDILTFASAGSRIIVFGSFLLVENLLALLSSKA
ncbi:MAG: folC [Gammaproteobacteria bacterium]|jgi:dihydrofolate synthase/folylpolyglutamate synthase|nr:folC [Gammaproteobacteria bacterium]